MVTSRDCRPGARMAGICPGRGGRARRVLLRPGMPSGRNGENLADCGASCRGRATEPR